jgi:tetratricopeptide (TPR) repeat protein
MVAAVILVAIVALVPLAIWAMRARAQQSVRWHGIDWSRGLSEGAKRVAEGARLHREARYAEALVAYDRAVALDADDADALLARAVTRQRLGRLDEALADYDRAIALRGPTSEALNNRGCLQRDRGELDRALADVEEAVRLAPTDPVAQVSLAEVRAARGEWDAATDALDRGIALDASWRAHARDSEALAPLRAARPDAAAFRG